MTRETRWATGLILGGIGGWILYKLWHRFADDRPPIRVRSGSIIFEHDHGWELDNGEWKTGQVGGKRVKNFLVKAHGSNCELRGKPVEITYESETGNEETFRVIAAAGEPKIVPGHLLNRLHQRAIAHGNPHRGRIARVAVPPHDQCTFEPSERVEIEIDYEYEGKG